MLSPTLEHELHQQMEHLPPSQQRQVLEFARALAAGHPVGVLGQNLLPLAGTIEASELVIMAKAIEEDCEQIHQQDW